MQYLIFYTHRVQNKNICSTSWNTEQLHWPTNSECCCKFTSMHPLVFGVGWHGFPSGCSLCPHCHWAKSFPLFFFHLIFHVKCLPLDQYSGTSKSWIAHNMATVISIVQCLANLLSCMLSVGSNIFSLFLCAIVILCWNNYIVSWWKHHGCKTHSSPGSTPDVCRSKANCCFQRYDSYVVLYLYTLLILLLFVHIHFRCFSDTYHGFFILCGPQTDCSAP